MIHLFPDVNILGNFTKKIPFGYKTLPALEGLISDVASHLKYLALDPDLKNWAHAKSSEHFLLASIKSKLAEARNLLGEHQVFCTAL